MLDLLIIGGGMYVAGRGTETYGTIMPALLEARRKGMVCRLGVATTNAATALETMERVVELSKKMRVNGQCDRFPLTGTDNRSYIKAVDQFKPDAVIISVPDHLHAAISIPIIEMGIHCMIVKPMADSYSNALKMAETAEKANVIAQVEFHKRLDESNLLMLDVIKNEKLGKLLYAVIEYSQQKRIPTEIFKKWADKTSVFQYLGVHYIDLLLYITNFQPKRVTAWGQKDYLIKKGINTWDSMQVVVEWMRQDNGQFTSTHLTNWIDPNETSAVSDQKINIIGTKGRFQADQKHRGNQVVTDGVGVKDINPYFSASWQKPYTDELSFNGYGIKSIIQFISDVHAYNKKEITINELNKIRPSFKNCLISSAVVDAAHRSLAMNSVPIEIIL